MNLTEEQESWDDEVSQREHAASQRAKDLDEMAKRFKDTLGGGK